MRPSTGNRLHLTGPYETFLCAALEAVRASAPAALVTIGNTGTHPGVLSSGCFDDASFNVLHFDSFETWDESRASVNAKQCALFSVHDQYQDPESSALSLEELQSSYLGALCTQYPEGVFIEYRGAPSTARSVLFASGFAERIHWQEPDVDSADSATLFVYRLNDYKSPPAWLNSKYWANPERFDLPPE